MPLPLASLLLLLLSTHSALALRICSFNVRSFGESKKANCNAMDVIVKVSPPSCQKDRWTPFTLSLQLSDFKRLRRNLTEVSP